MKIQGTCSGEGKEASMQSVKHKKIILQIAALSVLNVAVVDSTSK
jgi:hypothetical protein